MSLLLLRNRYMNTEPQNREFGTLITGILLLPKEQRDIHDGGDIEVCALGISKILKYSEHIRCYCIWISLISCGSFGNCDQVG